MGAALEQEIEKDVWVPIAFASRFLIDQEKKYSTNELELLAIVWSCEHFRNYLLGNHFVLLTDHKAISSALKTNRGNKTHQSRLTRWADRLLPFDFDIFHISGCKLGIVVYLSRFPTFEAPRPSSCDEQYVVKCISQFFDACDYLDGWVRVCSLSEESSDISRNNQNFDLSNSINLIEPVDFGQPRANFPFWGNSLISSKDIGNQSVEGVKNWDIQVTAQYIKSVEGDEHFDFGYTEICKQFNALVTSPLEGVRISGLKSSQSALSWFRHVFVTFSAWITIYLPILSLVWIISTVICDWGILSSSVGLLDLISVYWNCWRVFVLLGVFHFQTVMDTNTKNANDSFEQLLNQFIPINQHWFSSDRARPRFHAGAVRPKRSTTLQRGAVLRGQYARILANFRSKRLRISKSSCSVNRHVQSVQSLEILKSSVVAQDQKSLTGLVGILDSDVLSELTDEDSSLCLMKRALINRDYEGFCRIDSYLKSFWH